AGLVLQPADDGHGNRYLEVQFLNWILRKPGTQVERTLVRQEYCRIMTIFLYNTQHNGRNMTTGFHWT
ncbi:MAG: hypothetical protein RBT68_10555, partial [Spirochaetia bacterium]|nr:hypothetical protein [Spirochaetia bacterium]